MYSLDMPDNGCIVWLSVIGSWYGMGGWSYVYFQHVFIHHADKGRRGNLILLIINFPHIIIGSRGHPDLVVTITPATFNLADCVITVFICKSMVYACIINLATDIELYIARSFLLVISVIVPCALELLARHTFLVLYASLWKDITSVQWSLLQHSL